jgi:hypothetical protein
MKDKHLNKCKDCCKSDAEDRRAMKEATDPEWEVAERARHREKSRKYREAGRGQPQSNKNKNHSYSIKQVRAVGKASKAVKSGKIDKKPCEVCSSTVAVQGHHEDYDRPLYLKWLCVRHHNDRHIHLRDCETLNQTPAGITQWIHDMKAKTTA